MGGSTSFKIFHTSYNIILQILFCSKVMTKMLESTWIFNTKCHYQKQPHVQITNPQLLYTTRWICMTGHGYLMMCFHCVGMAGWITKEHPDYRRTKNKERNEGKADILTSSLCIIFCIFCQIESIQICFFAFSSHQKYFPSPSSELALTTPP